MSVRWVVLKLKETIYAKCLAQFWDTVNLHQTLVIFVIRCLRSLSISIPAIQNIYTAEGIKKPPGFPGSFNHHSENFKMFQLFDLKNKAYFCASGFRDSWEKQEIRWVPRRTRRLADGRGLLTPGGSMQALVFIQERIKRSEAVAVRQLMKHKHQGSLLKISLEFYCFWKKHHIPDDNKNLAF